MGYPVNKQSSVRIWGRGDGTCFSMYPDGRELGFLLAKLISAPLGMSYLERSFLGVFDSMVGIQQVNFCHHVIIHCYGNSSTKRDEFG